MPQNEEDTLGKSLAITEQMIAAGAAIVRQFDPRFEDEECVAEEVFRTMLSISDEDAGLAARQASSGVASARPNAGHQ